MGRAKEAWLQAQENHDAAAQYLADIGALNQCEFHGTIYSNWSDMSEFYPIAVAEWKKGENGKVGWAADMTVREYTDCLKSAFDDHCSDSCYGCDKIAAE